MLRELDINKEIILESRVSEIGRLERFAMSLKL